MLENSTQPLSVAALFAEREAHLRHEKEMEEQLAHKKEEELADYKKRLEEFKLSKAFTDSLAARIRRAFDHGETELMFASFPSNFCTDEGRAIKQCRREPDQQARPKWRHPGHRTTVARDLAERGAAALRLLEEFIAPGWLFLLRAHHQLSRRDARRCRLVHLVAEEPARRDGRRDVIGRAFRKLAENP